MNYQETLDYLYQQLPIFSRIGAAAYKADLGNIVALSALLGNPHQQFKCVHIAGTNGKGSCSHMIASILQSAGYKVGLYTSPHIIDFRERIRINGEMIPQQAVVDFVARMRADMEHIQPSFFELTVAMAFDYFASNKVDIAVVEVGLGGLLDSTNIIHPELSVITNISLDHTQLLGNTIADIATQKAGIIKTHVPVVIGERLPETEAIFRNMADQHKSAIRFAEDTFTIVSSQMNGSWREMQVQKKNGELYSYTLDLQGAYQEKNILTVLTAIEQLQQQRWAIGVEAIREGLRAVKQRTGLRGRFEVLHEKPYVIADVAHNEAGIRALLKQVNELPHQHLWIVTGFVQDKDVDHVLQLFPGTAQYFFTQAAIPRAMPFEELFAKGLQAGLNGNAYPSIQLAMNEAMRLAGPNDLILVTGSFFILEDVFRLLQKN